MVSWHLGFLGKLWVIENQFATRSQETPRMVAQVKSEDKQAGRWIEPWAEESPQRRSIDAELPEDDVARRIDRVVEMFLDLKGVERSYAGRGHRAYPPRLLLKVVLYAKHRGLYCPSQWHYEARRNLNSFCCGRHCFWV